MIWAFFKPAWGLVKSLPKEVFYVIGAAVFLWWFAGAQYDRGYDARDAEYAEAARKAAEQARKADQAASTTATQTTDEVEQGNEDARSAANGSSDPLRDGFDSLRQTD